MKKIFILVTILLLNFTFISFAEIDFSDVKNSPMPSVVDFEKIYNDYEEKEKEFYVIDFDGGYTLPNLIKDPLINELKFDIENNSVSNENVSKSNYPELFEKFDIEIISCKDGSKFVVLSEKKLRTESSTIMKYIIILVILSLIIVILVGSYYKKINKSKKRELNISPKNKKYEYGQIKENKENISKKFNTSRISIEDYNKLKDENKNLKSKNEELKHNQSVMAEDKKELLIEIEKRRNKEEELISEFNARKKEYLNQKKILAHQKSIEIDKETERILNEKIKEKEKEFKKIKNKYDEELENINKEKRNIKKKEIELEEKNKNIEKQKLDNEKQIESMMKFIKMIEKENSKKQTTEVIERYKSILPKELSNRLYEAEMGFLKASDKRDYSSEVIAYTKIVEIMLVDATPLSLSKKKFNGVKSRLNELKTNTGISKKVRIGFNKFYEDAELKGFFEIRNGSAHTKITKEEELIKLRNFLFYDDVIYYANKKEYRFDWLLRMIILNQEKEWKNK